MSDCLNDRLKVTFDDQEVTEMRKINRSDVLMAYQEKYGGYGTNDVSEIAVCVMIEKGGAGGIVAAPVAGQIFDYYFSR